jgi:glycerol-3-phosphate O-acyltransferase
MFNTAGQLTRSLKCCLFSTLIKVWSDYFSNSFSLSWFLGSGRSLSGGLKQAVSGYLWLQSQQKT